MRAKQTHTHKQNTKESYMHNLDNNHSINTITPTTMPEEKICVHIFILNTINNLIIKKTPQFFSKYVYVPPNNEKSDSCR
jgi:hypothetical protein